MSQRPTTSFDLPSAGGVIVKAYRWDPSGSPRAVVRLTHGMGEHARRYGALAEALTARGYVVYAQDHRGHGATIAANSGEAGAIGTEGWGELVADIGRLGEVTTTEHPGLPQALVSHSMGSFAAQQWLLDHSTEVAAAVLTGTAVLDLLEPALDLSQPLDLAMFNAPFAPARTDYDWLSRDEEQVDLYVADPLCGFGLDGDAGREMFRAARRMADPEALAALRKDLPLLVAVGEHDPVNGQMALVHGLVERYTGAGLTDVTLVSYPGARHEVFNEINRDEVITRVADWLDSRLPG